MSKRKMRDAQCAAFAHNEQVVKTRVDAIRQQIANASALLRQVRHH